jgi:hypothetical protein
MRILLRIRQFAFLVILIGALLPGALLASPQWPCPVHWCDMGESCQYGGGWFYQYPGSGCRDSNCLCWFYDFCDSSGTQICQCAPCTNEN